MGTPAEKLDDKTPDPKPDDKEEELKSEEIDQEEVEEHEDAPQKKQLSQEEVNAIVAKQKQRLKKDNQKLAEDSEKTAKELAAEREKNRLLQLALEQRQQKSGPPDPNDYDGGEFDPAFIKAKDEYTQKLIDQRVTEGLTEAEKKRQEQEAQREKQFSLEKRQEQHYQRVNELGVKDYIETEDKVLEIMGHDVVNEIINNFDDSHLLFYHLGKNPAKAERLAELIKSSPIKGVAEIGRIQASLKVESKSNDTPEPEEELEGGSSANPWQRKYDALYRKYEKGQAKLQDLLDLKKQAKAKGVEIST